MRIPSIDKHALSMPAPRFVEVVDVSAEASSTVAALLASGQGLVGKLSFNVSEYLNTSYGRDVLLSTLTAYNVTPDWDDWQWAGLAGALNITPPDVPVPRGPARHLLLVGVAMVLLREAAVRWRVRRLHKRYGHYA
jgi:hypothetical protein